MPDNLLLGNIYADISTPKYLHCNIYTNVVTGDVPDIAARPHMFRHFYNFTQIKSGDYDLYSINTYIDSSSLNPVRPQIFFKMGNIFKIYIS